MIRGLLVSLPLPVRQGTVHSSVLGHVTLMPKNATITYSVTETALLPTPSSTATSACSAYQYTVRPKHCQSLM